MSGRSCAAFGAGSLSILNWRRARPVMLGASVLAILAFGANPSLAAKPGGPTPLAAKRGIPGSGIVSPSTYLRLRAKYDALLRGATSQLQFNPRARAIGRLMREEKAASSAAAQPPA